MKHSAALKLKVGDVIVVNNLRDGILYEIISICFPKFTIQERDTNYKPRSIDYCYFQKPTAAQLNSHNKRKEKYYANNSNTSTHKASN